MSRVKLSRDRAWSETWSAQGRNVGDLPCIRKCKKSHQQGFERSFWEVWGEAREGEAGDAESEDWLEQELSTGTGWPQARTRIGILSWEKGNFAGSRRGLLRHPMVCEQWAGCRVRQLARSWKVSLQFRTLHFIYGNCKRRKGCIADLTSSITESSHTGCSGH